MEWNKEIKLKCKEPVETVHETGDVEVLRDSYRNFVFLTQEGTAYTPDYVTQIIKKIIASYNRDEERKAKQEKKGGCAPSRFLSPLYKAYLCNQSGRAGSGD